MDMQLYVYNGFILYVYITALLESENIYLNNNIYFLPLF